MELKITTPEDRFLKTIEFNLEEIKKELELSLTKYQGLTYSDEQIKLAKVDRADLNKFKDAIETKRKDIKKLCMSPYDDFEIKVKEITSMILKPIGEIDTQIKTFEEKQKEEKRTEIELFFNENIKDFKDVIDFQKIYNPKWLTTAYTIKKIKEEIQTAIDTIIKDFDTIEALDSNFLIEIKNEYIKSLSLSNALAIKTRLEEMEKKEEERKIQAEKRAEERRIELEKIEEQKKAQPKKVEIKPVVVPVVVPEIKVEVATEQVEEELVYAIELRLFVNNEQRELLKQFIISNKIKCERLDGIGA